MVPPFSLVVRRGPLHKRQIPPTAETVSKNSDRRQSLVRVNSCDFVDRLLRSEKRSTKSHEITPTKRLREIRVFDIVPPNPQPLENSYAVRGEDSKCWFETPDTGQKFLDDALNISSMNLKNVVSNHEPCGYNQPMRRQNGFDVAVVGAGAFGVWTAYQLRQEGASVVLIDAYGPGNSRSSSGGESRIIRIGYGPDEIYSRYALRSFSLWREFFERIELAKVSATQRLFRRTGVLWLARGSDPYCEAILEILPRFNVQLERLEFDELRHRYPQFEFAETSWGILEPDSGALMARRAVQAVAVQAELDGTTVLTEKMVSPQLNGKLNSLSTTTNRIIYADKFVFACGPWLPKLFPEQLKDLIHVTRQEVCFFGTPAGDDRFSPERMPIWVDFNDLVYAVPNLESRGFKLAIDAHGPDFDPDTGDRVVTAAGIDAARAYLQKRIPALANAPVIESRVCQYENTYNGDFLIDRHPAFENVWVAGGGSGHGFKHGPAVAEYICGMLSERREPEPRFALATKRRVQQRQVF